MKKILFFVCSLLVFIFSSATSVNAVDFGFTAVAEHPSAAIQPTAMGKVLRTAFLDGNKIYFGYGDYGANTGPIDIIPFDADSFTFLPKEFTSFTEAIYMFRKLPNGNLYALHTDPQQDLSNGADPTFQPDFSVKDSSGWTQKMPVGMTHTFDIAQYNGKIYLIGSKGNNAVVYESSDGDLSFNESFSLPPASTTLVKFGYQEFSRFYFAGQVNGKLYVQPVDYWGGKQQFSKIFDGVNWANGPDLLSIGNGYNINTFLGNLVYQEWEIGGSLYAFDGNNAKKILTNLIKFYFIYEGELYAIEYPQEGAIFCNILKTRDLTNWELITSSLPSVASSFVIYNGVIFVGASDSKVYKSNFNLSGIIKTPAISGFLALSPTSIRWNLLDNSSNETGFKLYDSQSNVLAESTVNTAYFDETGLAENTLYSRYIKAYNSFGESATSSVISAYTLVENPKNLLATEITAQSMKLSVNTFSGVEFGGSGYYFTNNTKNVGSGWMKTNFWIDNGLSCGTVYNYSVRYRNGNGVETAPIYFTQPTAVCVSGTATITLPNNNPVVIATTTITNATSSITTSTTVSSIDFLKAEVVRLTALIQTLTAQLLAIKMPVSPTVGLTVNMGLGGRGFQIKTLQSWLALDKSIYPEGLITGYFGKLTLLAVKRFQTKYASEVLTPRGLTVSDGIVENYTRAKLNLLFAK